MTSESIKRLLKQCIALLDTTIEGGITATSADKIVQSVSSILKEITNEIQCK